MLLHIDGSKHGWFQNSQRYDLIVILDGCHELDLLGAVGGRGIDTQGHGRAARGQRDQGLILRAVTAIVEAISF